SLSQHAGPGKFSQRVHCLLQPNGQTDQLDLHGRQAGTENRKAFMIACTKTPTMFPPASHIPNRGTKVQGRTLLISVLGVIIITGLIYFAFSHQTLSGNNSNQTQNAPVSQTQPAIPTAQLPTPTPTPLISR